jgi:Anaphase promoting complex subunit 8 / Cdc23
MGVGGMSNSENLIMQDPSMINRVQFTDAADEIMQSRKSAPLAPFMYHYFERPNAATDALNLARSLFDLREYRKCAHILKPYANEKYQSALFLHNLALYTVSEH